METSTPATGNRRKSFFNDSFNSSLNTPLRKSLNNKRNNDSLTRDENTDENERKKRRNQIQKERNLSSVSTPTLNLNESFIKEQFVVYTHLFSENKINAKNAWKLQIIDMLRPLCQKSQDVLQVASVSIDISAKVYGIRVDDVHTDGLKLANDMTRVYENVEQPGNDNEASDEDDEHADKTKKTQKKKKKISGVKSTINRVPKGNLGKLPKLEPVDFSTKVKADIGTIDNLLTSIIKESSSSFIILDDSKKLIAEKDPIIENCNKLPISSIPLPDKIGPIDVLFRNFRLDQWDPELEEQQFQSEAMMLSQSQPVVLDDNGFPLPTLDGSIHDIFDAVNDDDDNEEEVQNVNQLESEFRGTISNVVDFRPSESLSHVSEYSFNSVVINNGRYIDQIWAGPSHWKLKILKRTKPVMSGKKDQIVVTARGKKKVQPEKINFWSEAPMLDFSKVLKPKKKPPTVDIDKVTLPFMNPACVQIMSTLKELMSRPGVVPVEKKVSDQEQEQEDCEVGPYNYDNLNDSFYCSQSQPQDNDHNTDDEEVMVNEQIDGNLADNLVDNPETVPNTYIQYALKAKKMDMKKLKKTTWDLLTNNEEPGKFVSQNFSDLYKSLPELLPPTEKKELSSSLAFVALLHLCNEKNILLEQLEGYKDCRIMRPE